MRNKLIHALNGNGGGGAKTTKRKRAEKERASAGVHLNDNMFSQVLQLLSLLQSLLSQFGQCKLSGGKNQSIGSLLSSFVQQGLIDNKPKQKKKKKPKVTKRGNWANRGAASQLKVAEQPVGTHEPKPTRHNNVGKATPAQSIAKPSQPRSFAEVVRQPTAFQPVWQLRSNDWEGEVLSFDELAAKM